MIRLKHKLCFTCSLQFLVKYIPEKVDLTVLKVKIFVRVLGDTLVAEKIVIERD